MNRKGDLTVGKYKNLRWSQFHLHFNYICHFIYTSTLNWQTVVEDNQSREPPWTHGYVESGRARINPISGKRSRLQSASPTTETLSGRSICSVERPRHLPHDSAHASCAHTLPLRLRPWMHSLRRETDAHSFKTRLTCSAWRGRLHSPVPCSPGYTAPPLSVPQCVTARKALCFHSQNPITRPQSQSARCC